MAKGESLGISNPSHVPAEPEHFLAADPKRVGCFRRKVQLEDTRLRSEGKNVGNGGRTRCEIFQENRNNPI